MHSSDAIISLRNLTIMKHKSVLFFVFLVVAKGVSGDLEDWEDLEEGPRENGEQAPYVPRIDTKNPPSTGSGTVDYVYYDNREKMGTLDERLRKAVLNMKNKIAVPAVD